MDSVQNAKGYRFLEVPIEVDGTGMIISAILKRFLKHYRATTKEPTRLWIRHICVDQHNTHARHERALFWTRDWSDNMYAMATEVIDMNASNADLVDRGIVQQVHDRRYAEWNKELFRRLDKITLPKVYPIRLGAVMKYPRLEAPVADYRYSPLDTVANEVRIVVLVPSADPLTPIV